MTAPKNFVTSIPAAAAVARAEVTRPVRLICPFGAVTTLPA
jgi:hypothetical protein